MTFRYGKLKNGKWAWWITDRHDKVLAVGTQRHASKRACLTQLMTVKISAGEAGIEQSDAGFLD